MSVDLSLESAETLPEKVAESVAKANIPLLVKPHLMNSQTGHLELPLSEIVSALSYALDLTEGQAIGHAVRSCIIGMRLAQQLELDADQQAALYYALLLKDMGCSSNAARLHQLFDGDERQIKRDFKTTDWQNRLAGIAYVSRNAAAGQSLYQRFARLVHIARHGSGGAREMLQTRCERGARIADHLGFSSTTAEAIYSLDEHWNGGGHPQGLSGEKIPILARIVGLSQTFEVFLHARGIESAFEMLVARSGTWFDPQLVSAMKSLRSDRALWDTLLQPGASAARALAMRLEPGATILADTARLTRVCEGFASIIDAKSPWTYSHSMGVTAAARGMATVMGLGPERVQLIHHAALLHDLGKLAVPNSILDKPGGLTDAERRVVQDHPAYTERILAKVGAFDQLSFVAGAHHERLDGRGYHQGLSGDKLPLSARILAVADVFDALSAARPYRDAMPTEEALAVMRRDVPESLCAVCFEALEQWCEITSPAEREAQSCDPLEKGASC